VRKSRASPISFSFIKLRSAGRSCHYNNESSWARIYYAHIPAYGAWNERRFLLPLGHIRFYDIRNGRPVLLFAKRKTAFRERPAVRNAYWLLFSRRRSFRTVALRRRDRGAERRAEESRVGLAVLPRRIHVVHGHAVHERVPDVGLRRGNEYGTGVDRLVE